MKTDKVVSVHTEVDVLVKPAIKYARVAFLLQEAQETLREALQRNVQPTNSVIMAQQNALRYDFQISLTKLHLS